MIELGQMAFGNKWESVEAPHWMAGGLDDLQDAATGGEFYWPGVSNEVFDLRPYYWGDCDCGYEKAERVWSEAHKHSDNCYQSTLDAAKLAAGWTKSKYGFLDSPKGLTWDERRKIEDQIYRAECERHGIPWNDGLGCAVHCSCDHARLWREWSDANGHAETCPIVLPNFLHKPSGLAVHWYKHIGRSMTCSREIERKEWRKIVAECLAAVGAA